MISRHFVFKALPFLVFLTANNLYHYLLSTTNECPNGFFRIKPSDRCQSWLGCSDISDMTPLTLLTRGVVKKIYLYKYNDNYVVVSRLTDKRYVSDFGQTLEILRQLSPNPLLIQLIGWCNDDTLITEYHPFGDATHLASVLSETSQLTNFSVRLDLCVNYIQIIRFLHNSPIGTLVMCDSNTLEKTLSQYLLTTDMRLVLNDLDALPQVMAEGVKCGSRQVSGELVAPEQRWHSDQQFDDSLMKSYDHKTDIWKIPDVCHWFLTLGTNDSFSSLVESIEIQLKDMINGCKSVDRKERPSAEYVLQSYGKVFYK